MPATPKRETATQKLQRRNRELSILNTIAEALNREVDLQRALHTTLARVAELLGLQTGWIWLLRDDTDDPYLAVAQNLPPALANFPNRMDGSEYCYCLDSYQTGDLEGAANVNIIRCTRLKGLVDGTDGLRYHASVPLYAHGKKLGVLNVASTDWRKLSPDDLQLLYTVGDLLSMAIERARLFNRSAAFGAAEERNRLAREIHDTLAQGLAGIALQLETADALLEAEADPARVRQAIAQAMKLARSNLEEARRSVLDLRAAPLEGRTLSEALDVLAHDWAISANIQATFKRMGENRPLPARIEASLYRIAQEAITNAIRHAEAQRLAVALTIKPERVDLLIEDNGRGFDVTQVPQDRYGLIGLNERVKLLGGTMQIHSSIGEGTRLEVSVPLEQKS
ncbi:MAG: GAF domain-containing sensor histidine kinase [Anaerolineae bacterium]|nr:GAF domain-containing sensor histidine kinase [Anaerolineae bacterium]